MKQQLLPGEFLSVKDMSDEQLNTLVNVLHTIRAQALTQASRATKRRGSTKLKALPKRISVAALAAQLTEEERIALFSMLKGGKL